MKLAVNYSPQSALLLEQNKVKFDLFKCPDWPELVESALAIHPVYVHFTLATRSRRLEQADWEKITQYLKITQTQYVNLHLMSESSLDYRDHAAVRRCLQLIIDEIKRIGDRFGPEHVIIENIPFSPSSHDHLRPVVDPENISEISSRTGCRLLLDVCHAAITAATLQITPQNYMQMLPVNRLAELHITGQTVENGQPTDHRAMNIEDWQLLEWVLEQVKTKRWTEPDILAYEYGGFGKIFEPFSDPDVMLHQIPHLYKLINPVLRDPRKDDIGGN
jgi:uncharacterized protein (UPF0276 family)